MILWRLRPRWGMKKVYRNSDEMMLHVDQVYNAGDRLGCYASYRSKGRIHIDPRGKCGRVPYNKGLLGGRYLKVLCFKLTASGNWRYAGKHKKDKFGNGGNCK